MFGCPSFQGIDEAREELRTVVQFLKDPARFSRLGAKARFW
jgi:ATP-dependent Zn protease